VCCWSSPLDPDCEKQKQALKVQLAAAQQELTKTQDGSLIQDLKNRIASLVKELNELRAQRAAAAPPVTAAPSPAPPAPPTGTLPLPTWEQLHTEHARASALAVEVAQQKQEFTAQAKQLAQVRGEVKTLQKSNAQLQALAQQWQTAAELAEKALTPLQGRASLWLEEQLQPMLASMRATFQQQLNRVSTELKTEQDNSTELQLKLTQAGQQITKLQAQIESLTTEAGVVNETQRTARAELLADTVATVRNLTSQLQSAADAGTAREATTLRRIAVLERALQAVLASWRDTQQAQQDAEKEVAQLQKTLARTRASLNVVNAAYVEQGKRLRGMEEDTAAWLEAAKQDQEELIEQVERESRWRREQTAELFETEAKLEEVQRTHDTEVHKLESDLATLQQQTGASAQSQTTKMNELTAQFTEEQANHAARMQRLRTESQQVLDAKQREHDLALAALQASKDRLNRQLQFELGQAAAGRSMLYQTLQQNIRELNASMAAQTARHAEEMSALQQSLASKERANAALIQKLTAMTKSLNDLKLVQAAEAGATAARQTQLVNEISTLRAQLVKAKGTTQDLEAANARLVKLETELKREKRAAAVAASEATKQITGLQNSLAGIREIDKIAQEQIRKDVAQLRKLRLSEAAAVETARLMDETTKAKQLEVQQQAQRLVQLELQLDEVRAQLRGRADVDTRVAQLEAQLRAEQQKYDNLVAEMTCPVCLELKDKMEQPTRCKHKVCAADQLMLNACPICREPYSGVPQAAQEVEATARERVAEKTLKPVVPVAADLSPMEAASQFVRNVQDMLRNAISILPNLPSLMPDSERRQQRQRDRLEALQNTVRQLDQVRDRPTPITDARGALDTLHKTLNELSTADESEFNADTRSLERFEQLGQQTLRNQSDIVIEGVRTFVEDALNSITEPSEEGQPAFTSDLVRDAQDALTAAATGAQNLTDRALWLGEWALRTVRYTHEQVRQQDTPDPQFARIMTDDQLEQRRRDITTLANEIGDIVRRVEANVINLRMYARQPLESVNLNVADALEDIRVQLGKLKAKVQALFDNDQDVANEWHKVVIAGIDAEEKAVLRGKRVVRPEPLPLLVENLPQNLALVFINQVVDTLIQQTGVAQTYLRALQQPLLSRLVSVAGDTYVSTTLECLQVLQWFNFRVTRLIRELQASGGEGATAIANQLSALMVKLQSINYSSVLADAGMGLLRVLQQISAVVATALTQSLSPAVGTALRAFMTYGAPIVAFVTRLIGGGLYRAAVAAYNALERMMTSLYTFGTEAATRAAEQLLPYFTQLNNTISEIDWHENLELLAATMSDIMAGVYSVMNQVNQVLGRAVSAAVRSVIAFSVFFSTVAGEAVNAMWRATMQQAQNAAELLGHMLAWLNEQGATVNEQLRQRVTRVIEELRQSDYQTPVDELQRRVSTLLTNAVNLVKEVWGSVGGWIGKQTRTIQSAFKNYQIYLVSKLQEFLRLLQAALQYLTATAVEGAVQTGRVTYRVAARSAAAAAHAVQAAPSTVGRVVGAVTSWWTAAAPVGAEAPALFGEIEEEEGGYEETKEEEVKKEPLCVRRLDGQRRSEVEDEMERLQQLVRQADAAAAESCDAVGGRADVLDKSNSLSILGKLPRELEEPRKKLKEAVDAQRRYLAYRKKYLQDCLFKSNSDEDVKTVSKEQTTNNEIGRLIGGYFDQVGMTPHRDLTRYERKALDRLQAGMQRKYAIKQRWHHTSGLLKAGAINRRTFEKHVTKLNEHYQDAHQHVVKGIHKLEKL
jgi:DNA repair exonuclease SbcCD ATPase subunit